MKKRAVTMLAILMLLAIVFVQGGAPADAATQRYQVGYAIRDVNPYVYSENLGIGVQVPEELLDTEKWVHDAEIGNPATGKITSEKMIGVPLSGYANSAERPSGGIYDDNGDGFTGLGDGIHATCTTVTDERGVTLIYFTIDAISGYANLGNAVAKGAAEKLGSTVQVENVFLNGSHTHEGPDYGTLGSALSSEKSTAKKEAKAEAEAAGVAFDEAAFNAGFVGSDKARLWDAYYNYVVDTMVDAAVECYNNRTEAVMTKGTIDASESSGYQLNFIRNYTVEEYKYRFEILGKKYYETTPNKVFQFGSNYGKSAKPVEDKTVKRLVRHVSEADDAMHILQFTPTNGDQPIVLVNWRSHATMMSGTTGGGTGALIAADYISSFRYEMQKAGYRMAFLQGAAGNTVSSSSLGTPWSEQRPTAQYPDYAIYYGGQMLTGVALDCIKNHMTDELAAGPIHSLRWNLDLEKQTDPEGLIAAATYYQDNGLTSSNYKYTHTDGKVYIINSKHHARNVVNRSTANPDTYGDMTVNAFMLGESVAFVTAPTEISDRYSLTATLDNTTDNDWDDLINANTYGTPFVLGYTNGHNGYTANKLAFSFNEGSSEFGVGSYEANSSRTAPGEGERIVANFKIMLDVLENGYKEAYCEHCKKTVEWVPLFAQGMRKTYTLGSGHYYLYEDSPIGTDNNGATIVGNVCFDLNGKTMNCFGRAFILNGAKSDEGGKSTLNLMDSVGGGSVNSYDSPSAAGGGCIGTQDGATIHMYGGTLRTITGEEAYVVKGGVIALNNTTMYMYGGTIDASQCYMVKDPRNVVSGDTDGCGAAIAIYSSGKLYCYGGRIIAGHAEPEEGRADCVLVQGTNANITLSGNPEIDELYFESTPAKTLVINGNFTGKVTLNYRPTITLKNNLDIGNLTNNGNFDDGEVTCAVDGFYPVKDGTNIRLNTAIATVVDGNQITTYGTLKDALNAAAGKLVVLQRNIAEAVNVTEDAYLDLNGYAVNRDITVAEGCTLYCKDSATDDYTVSDGKCGKLYGVEGNVQGIPQESALAEDGYLMVEEEDGMLSFHRVSLGIQAMSLRPEVNGVAEPGVYYKGYFAGDEKVAGYVDTFGVALSVNEMPNAENMETKCKYSWYQGFVSGDGTGNASSNGVLLKGIMKGRNSDAQNAKYAAMPVYGSAYIKDIRGNYIFGDGVSRSLQEQMELVDAQWDTLGDSKAAVVAVYRKFLSVMEAWDVPNIQMGNYNNDLIFTSGNKAYCPVCRKEVAWTAVTQEANGTTSIPRPMVTGSHYYLAEDIVYTGTDNFFEGPGSSRTLCIHLNGHNFTGKQSQFLFGYGSKSRVMGNGIVSNGKNSASSGAVVWNTGTKTGVEIHLYGGTYTVTPENTLGSAISIQNNGGEIHIHRGVKVIGSATVPAILIGSSHLRTSELYIDGATIEGSLKIKDLAKDNGFSTTVAINDSTVSSVELGKDVSFTVSGDTVIGKLQVNSGAKFTVGQLTGNSMITVAGAGVISTVNDNMADYVRYFKPFSGELTVKDNALYMSK